MRMSYALKSDPEYSVHIRDEKEEVSEDGLYVSEEEYWAKYYNHPDFSYEWKNGYLEEKPMADVKSSFVYDWFSDILKCYLSAYPIGTSVSLDIGFRLELPDDTSIRKPDRALVLHDNPVMLHLADCNFDGTFDICIESLSYSEKKEIIRDTVDKKKEYQGVGVREYYILDARKIETAFYRLKSNGKYSKIKPVRKDIIRSEVLPGFQFRIRHLYEQPPLEKLTEDEVYQGYVLPFHQKVKQRAEYAELLLVSEQQKAEQERQRAESEKQRAEYAELQLISERLKAEQERQCAEQVSLQFIAEHQRAEQAEQRAALLAEKLKQLGISVE